MLRATFVLKVQPFASKVASFFCINVVADVCWFVHKPGCEKMNFPQSLNEARASFLVNLAGVYSLRSEFDKARKCLQQVRTIIPLQP